MAHHRTIPVLIVGFALAACDQGPVTVSDPEPKQDQAPPLSVPEPAPAPEWPRFGPCANGACAEDPTIIGFLYATELLLSIGDRGWPACPVDVTDPRQTEKFRNLHTWLMTHVARVPGYITLPNIDAMVDALGCEWVRSGELVTVYNVEPRVDGGSRTEFSFESSVDPVSGVVWEFTMVQVWNDRLDGYWWPQAFLCLEDMPGVTPTWHIPPRRCSRGPVR